MDIGSKSENAPYNVDRIKELEFELTGVSDPMIISKITEPPKYFEPPRLHPEDKDDFSLNCEKILPAPQNYKKTYFKPSWYKDIGL